MTTIPALYSCDSAKTPDNPAEAGTTIDNNQPNGTIGANETPAEGEPKDPAYQYDSGKIDFKGETFTIIYPNWSLYEDYYFAEEESAGDAINDVLYKRILDAEEFFNIEIQTRIPGYIESIQKEIDSEVKADINTFDIALTHCISGLDTIVVENLAYNWNLMPNVDFTKKYWNQSMNDYLSID